MQDRLRFSPALRALCVLAFLVTVGFIFLRPPPEDAMRLFWDKGVHFVVYGGLAFLLWIALEGRRAWPIFLAVAELGALDELHQYYTPGRQAGVDDLVADALGAACVLLVLRRIGPWLAPAARTPGA